MDKPQIGLSVQSISNMLDLIVVNVELLQQIKRTELGGIEFRNGILTET